MIYPSVLNTDVKIFLKNETSWIEGYWDGTSWWEELGDSDEVRLISEDTIDHWEWFE